MKWAVAAGLVAMQLLASCGSGDDGGSTEGASVQAGGQELYERTCATCHGTDLNGTRSGPPFLSDIYVPSHHPDESFYAAVANGVQPHHWDFGPMPAYPSLDRDDVAAIIDYIRSEQEKAGIAEP